MVSNEENQEEEIMPELQPEDMFRMLWLAINSAGGTMLVPRTAFEKMPKDATVVPEYHKNGDYWELSTEPKLKKPKRGKIIVKKKAKLYLPPNLKIVGSG